MVVELHRKVSSLIEYLKQKWTYHDQRIVSFETHTRQLPSSKLMLAVSQWINNICVG